MFLTDANTGMLLRSFYWEGCGMYSCEAPSWTPICLFFWSFLFGLEEKLSVDFLDSKHDEVLMCRSLLDHLKAYLLILPWTSQLCPLAAVIFLEFIMSGQFLSCSILILIRSSWLRQPVELGSFWWWQEVWGGGGVCGHWVCHFQAKRIVMNGKCPSLWVVG